jgi:hypothetical protein
MCTISFEINGVKFSKYYAKDAHGSVSQNYWVDKSTLPYKDFCVAMANAMDKVPGMQEVVCYAMTHHNIHRHTELHRSMREVKELEAKSQGRL